VLASAGLPRVSFHALRHSYASALLAQGVHPRVMMEALGHSQISLTLNLYAHAIPQLQREAADSLDMLLG
jgi:site-specific recombinase XerD